MEQPPINPYQAPHSSQPSVEDFGDYVEPSFKQALFSFEGRFNRARYWKYILISTLIFLIIGAIVVALAAAFVKQLGAQELMLIALIILYIPSAWACLAITAKRWHDRGKSGWWSLINVIPYVGGIWAFIECGCLEGNRGTNAYGADPLGKRP